MSSQSKTLTEILEEQYSLTEDFANSQSRLLNVSMAKSSDEEITSALVGMTKSRQRVRSSLERLHEEDFFRTYPAHVNLSNRVVQTIAKNPSWHSNGIPSHVTNILETNTVALATLKASISRIIELEKEQN